MHRGFIKLYRYIQDDRLWTEKPFDRARAWIDLMILANHKEGTIRKRGILLTVKRGQIGWSETQLAERWGWSRKKVHRFLEELKKEKRIEQQNEQQNLNVTSLITILNYDGYQCEEPQMEPQKHRRSTPEDTMNKNEKKKDFKTLSPQVKKSGGKPPTPYSEEFESFWQVIPSRAKRGGKQEAWKSWQGKVQGHVEVSAVIAAVKAHMTSHDWTKEGGKYIPMITTWLNQRRWEVEMAALDVRPDCEDVSAVTSLDRASRMRKVLANYGD